MRQTVLPLPRNYLLSSDMTVWKVGGGRVRSSSRASTAAKQLQSRLALPSPAALTRATLTPPQPCPPCTPCPPCPPCPPSLGRKPPRKVLQHLSWGASTRGSHWSWGILGWHPPNMIKHSLLKPSSSHDTSRKSTWLWYRTTSIYQSIVSSCQRICVLTFPTPTVSIVECESKMF